MRYIISLTILLLTCVISRGQSSLFYNNNGKFYADTSIQISISDYKLDVSQEKFIIAKIIDKIEYPGLLYENGISGMIIVNLEINTRGIIKQYKDIENQHPQLVIPIQELIKKLNSDKDFVNRLKSKSNFTFNLAFNFGYADKPNKSFKNGVINIFVVNQDDLTGK